MKSPMIAGLVTCLALGGCDALTGEPERISQQEEETTTVDSTVSGIAAFDALDVSVEMWQEDHAGTDVQDIHARVTFQNPNDFRAAFNAFNKFILVNAEGDTVVDERSRGGNLSPPFYEVAAGAIDSVEFNRRFPETMGTLYSVEALEPGEYTGGLLMIVHTRDAPAEERFLWLDGPFTVQ